MGQRRGKGDGTLFKRKDGMWVGGVEMPAGPDGKRRTKRVTGKSRNTVIEKLRKLQKAMAAGEVPTAPSTTVQRWLEYWCSDILPARDIRPATIYSYEGTVKRYLIPHLGAKRLDRVQPADIRQLYKTLNGKVSTRASQKADQVLRMAFEAAMREGLLGVNIMDRVDKPAHVKTEGTAFDSRTAMRIIETAVATQGTMWGARWAFGFLTGARESEVLGMEWNRIDLTRGIADISWQLNRQQRMHSCGPANDGVFPCGRQRPGFCPQSKWRFTGEMRPCVGTLAWTRPKTRAGVRLIPLVPALVDILAQIQDSEPNPHNLVFHKPDGRPIDTETDQRTWKELLVTAQVPHAPQHSIRHSTATLLLEAGVDAHIVQSVIGHTDIVTTRGYQHVNLDLARQAWGNLATLLPAVTVTDQ